MVDIIVIRRHNPHEDGGPLTIGFIIGITIGVRALLQLVIAMISAVDELVSGMIPSLV